MAVVITRRRHPLEGLALRVLGQMRRHGRLELLLVLPDGNKSLIPAAWTDLVEHLPAEAIAGAITLLASVIAKAAIGVEIEVTRDE